MKLLEMIPIGILLITPLWIQCGKVKATVEPEKFLEAAAEGKVAVMEVMLTKRVDIDAQDERGRTALHLALTNHNLPMADLLLLHGANPLIRDINGKQAIAYIDSNLFSDPLFLLLGERLVAMGSDVNQEQIQWSELRLAVLQGDSQTVIAKLETMNPEEINAVDDGSLWPSLHAASAVGNVAIVELLVKAGADPDATSSLPYHMSTPVVLAAIHGHRETYEKLLELGAGLEPVYMF